jgi:hypothetical protein
VSRQNRQDQKTTAKKMALGVQRQRMLVPLVPKTSPLKKQLNKKNWTVKEEIHMLLSSESVSVLLIRCVHQNILLIRCVHQIFFLSTPLARNTLFAVPIYNTKICLCLVMKKNRLELKSSLSKLKPKHKLLLCLTFENVLSG